MIIDIESKDVLVNIVNELKARQAKVKSLLKNPIQGDLVISKNIDGIRFYKSFKNNDKRVLKGISRNKDIVYRLANQKFLHTKLNVIDKNIKELERISNKYLSFDNMSIIDMLPSNYEILDKKLICNTSLTNNDAGIHPINDEFLPLQNLKAHFILQNQFEWASRPYRENTFHPEAKVHLSSHGIYARSKSEVAIIDIYEELKIPYHYDELVLMNGKTISPDFIGLRNDGAIVLHEHLGMMNNTDYCNAAYSKILRYQNAGFVIGKNLLITYDNENGYINLDLIKKQLMDFYRL